MKKQRKPFFLLAIQNQKSILYSKKAGNMTNTEDIIKIRTQRIILK